MKTKHVKFNDEDIIKCLLEGSVVAFPTETVYGLGVIFDEKKAFDALVQAKNRNPDKPFTLMLGDIKEIEKYAYVNERIKKLIDKYMPGEITLLLKPKKNLYSWVTLGGKYIGIRVPNYQEVCQMIKKVGKPMLVTSANISNNPVCKNYLEVCEVFDGKIDMIVEGETKSSIPSTIVICDEELTLIRQGNIDYQDIKEIWEEKQMKISIGCDHGGLELKKEIINYLNLLGGYEIVDVGTDTLASCDYPDYAHKAAELVERGTCERGILVCTSGEGVSIVANKHKGIRCGLIYNEEVARLTRQHNNVNMVAFGAKFITVETCLKCVDLFLNTDFEGGRHLRRVEKIEK